MPESPGEKPAFESPAASAEAPLRIGIAGAAAGRSLYRAVLAATPSVTVVGLVDADPGAARVWAREIRGKVPIHATLEPLLAAYPALDAVLIASPLPQRSAQIAAASQARMPILCEIPFAPTLAEMDAVLRVAADNGVLLMPALTRRVDAPFLQMAAQAASGAIGEVRQARCDWSFLNEESGEDAAGRDANARLQSLACQTADLCRGWLGDATAVSGAVDVALAGSRDRTPTHLIVTHARGQSTHHLTRSRSVQPSERYVLTGTQGSLELVVSAGMSAAPTPSLTLYRTGERPERIRLEPFPESRSLSPTAARRQQLLRHFAACVRTGVPPLLQAADARAALEIVHAAYLSTQEDSKVSLPLRQSPDIAMLLRAIGQRE